MTLAPVRLPKSCGGSHRCSRSRPSQGQHSAASVSRRRRRQRRGPRRAPPPGPCTTLRCHHGRVGASRSSHRTSMANASGSSPTMSFPPTCHGQPSNRETALRPWTPVFTHGDLQVAHVFVDDDEVTGVVDWSDACQGDGLFDLAILTLGHEEHLDDVVAGYGADVDLDVIRAWWSLRSLLAVRWLSSTASTRRPKSHCWSRPVSCPPSTRPVALMTPAVKGAPKGVDVAARSRWSAPASRLTTRHGKTRADARTVSHSPPPTLSPAVTTA